MAKIVITGSESTGKTELSVLLARHYNCPLIPEYARGYIENLNRPYTEEDVIQIARKQVEQYNHILNSGECVIFDTWLILTKVWLEHVYKSGVDWIDTSIRDSEIDLYILCSNDLPWIPDPVRENGGAMRDILFNKYKEELLNFNLPFIIVNGIGNERFSNTVTAIDNYLKNK